MHKNRLSKKALKTTGATSGRFAQLTPQMMKDAAERVLAAHDKRFSGVSLGADVEKDAKCSVCGNLNCGHFDTKDVWRSSRQQPDIQLFIHEEPVVELCENGDFKVRGKVVENDKELVEGFRMFLHQASPSRIDNCPNCGAKIVSSILYYDKRYKDM